MMIITIREQQQTATGFEAILTFQGGEYPITITDPFTAPEEKQLEWYFENWVTYPFSNETTASQVAQNVNSYGERLFKQVFQANFQAYSEYDKLRRNLSQVQIEIESNTPAFHALHWEAMRDPGLPRPLAVDCVMLRKNLKPSSVLAYFAESPVINLLVVIARPDEEHDVAYRTISRPLIELIQQSRLAVKVELLRPGTYEALERHLEEKGSGFYHIIHFDTHGALLKFAELQSGAQKKRYVYQARYGRLDLRPYDGVKAFLFLEGETKGEADFVEATELANLLTGKGIGVCILNACQSGKQIQHSTGEGDKQDAYPTGDDNARETSLGSRLMTAGMQMVVAMGYSVTVTAAELLMKTVYSHLFDKKSITEALRLGRRELFNQKGRKAYFNKWIDLEDWLLPVVYSTQQVNLNLREFSPEEEDKYWQEKADKYVFPLPTYGFVGRDLEILKIEKALLRHNILLLQGMGGTGKTTLLNYLREWWQTTQFAEDVFYFGYDTKAWTLEQILFEIGKRVYKRKDPPQPPLARGEFELAIFQTMNLRVQMQKLAAKLRSESYILILDNLESVTGQPLAIQNTLSEEEQDKLREFLQLLVNGKTRVIFGSRSGEEWLQETTFQTNIYPLQGLDEEASTDLAEKILKRHVAEKRIPTIREDADFKRLMKLLEGYPLAMEVVLVNLKKQTPTQILAGWQAANIPDVDSEDKTKSIVKCVEYSHSNLSPAAQNLLLCLAYFSGFIDRSDLPNFAKHLQKLEPFQSYAFDKFDDAIQEAINWGLLSPLDQALPNLLGIQPIFPYFLKMKLQTLDESTREALREGFKNHYLGLAGSYKQLMDSQDAQERNLGRFFCDKEYENLYTALEICLEKQASISIYFCLFNYFRLISDKHKNLQLAKFVTQALEKYPSTFVEGELGYQVSFAIGMLANCYLETKQYHLAKDYYQKTLEIYSALNGIEERQKQLWIASTYQHLGIVAQELREFAEARSNYQLALEIKIEFGERFDQARTYHNLGIVAQELREFAEARSNYQLALEIFIQFGERFDQASTYHHLGRVAQELREFAEARSNYQKALEIFIEFKDCFSQARTYHQLGMVAQELREFAEARSNYQLALEIKIEFGERFDQARTYHQLGIVAQELREFDEARSNYQKALEIFIEFKDCFSQARTYHQLGRVAQELREFAEARSNYQQALEICIQFGERFSQASTYYHLGRVAEELGELEEAKANYLQALQIDVEFNDQHCLGISLRNLARFYQVTRDENLLTEIAQILGVTVEEIRELFTEGED